MKNTWIKLSGLVVVLVPSSWAGDIELSRRTIDRSTREALRTPTVGAPPSPKIVVPPPRFSLVVDGSADLGDAVFRNGVPFLHSDPHMEAGNTAVGYDALVSVKYGPAFPFGKGNSAVGLAALRNNTGGSYNSGIGHKSLYGNVYGTYNTAIGNEALTNNDGWRNTAVGHKALVTNTMGGNNVAIGHRVAYLNDRGYGNTAIGDEALFFNSNGDWNTAVGFQAGAYWTTGRFNIALGYGSHGVFGESETIRIGGDDRQTITFVEGISATPVSGSQVRITGDDQPGIVASSAQFKQGIRDLEGISERLTSLRPVSFRYKDGVAGDKAANPIEYGLVAEEVAEVLPELVINDAEGAIPLASATIS